jgi:hypothetical protein
VICVGIRRALEFGWPTLVVLAACSGLGMANWLRLSPLVCGSVLVIAMAVAVGVDGRRRLVCIALGVLSAGLWWGGLRLEMLDRSVLAARVGQTRSARVTVTGPARFGRYALRAPAR